MEKMMRFFIVLSLLFLASCSGVRTLSTSGVIGEVDKDRGRVLIVFECVKVPFKNQPCFGADYFDIVNFPGAKTGQKIKISYTPPAVTHNEPAEKLN